LGGTRLQLDGYNKKLNLAFEYNGQQHYKYTPVFHRIPKRFEQQKKRDRKKLELCKKESIELVVIPYTERDNLEKFIRSQLKITIVNNVIDWRLFKGKPDKMKTIDEIIRSKHGKRMSNEPYENCYTPIVIKCAFGHLWTTHANRLVQGHWCYKCCHRPEGLSELATAEYLNALYYEQNLRIKDIAELFKEKHQIPMSYSSIRRVMLDRGIKLKPKSCRDYQRSKLMPV